ncbi:MAG: DMT family transporter [Gammaproteobacteria bacterium]|nr:DMT family transporter [Gammaproteobacteria bacterium]
MTDSNATHSDRPLGHGTAYLLAALSNIIWGTPPVVTRAIVGDVPPLTLSFLRWSLALLVLSPLVWPRLRQQWPMVRRHFRSLFLLATFMTAGSTLAVIAVYFTSATNAVLVNASQPAVTAVMALLIAGTWLSRQQKFGIAFAFTGIVIMICKGSLQTLLTLDINIGDLIMLSAVCGWSLYSVQLGRRDYRPTADVMMFIIALSGAVLLLPLCLFEMSRAPTFNLSGGVVISICYLALFPTLFATYLWNHVLPAIGPNRASIFGNLIPVSGAALAVIFLNEKLHHYHIIGAALVMLGIWLAIRRA